jgi:3-hydroxybutyryl-CoA dehydratase
MADVTWTTPPYETGQSLTGPIKPVTPERIEWYDSGMLSAAKGELAQVGSNIHTDDAYAKEQGLPGVIADGMMMTNWCQTMMLDHFGYDYVARGELRTKFIKPVYLGETVFVKGRIRSVEKQANGDLVYELDVWCDNQDGVKVTDGDGRVIVAATR